MILGFFFVGSFFSVNDMAVVQVTSMVVLTFLACSFVRVKTCSCLSNTTPSIVHTLNSVNDVILFFQWKLMHK